ncbi:hypothetical protein [Alicyclobacillus ferrooxydans]|uniref:hypothetical protein n=1 Tax=Alicyclobacillus ferrooxydans TaxID=471514 RepID=UPI0006D58D82|nr:hypothetical protein [Alicyclobacillus ferrooxydans]
MRKIKKALGTTGDSGFNRPWKQQRRRYAAVAAVGLMAIVGVAGCGAVTSNGTAVRNGTATSKGQNPNPPFANRLKEEPATPDPKFDPTQGQANVYDNVTVYTADGTKVVLNASQIPILFEAYWCPHCQRTLVLLHHNRSKLKQFPVLVSMGFAQGTSLAEAVKITQQEDQYFHLTNVKQYYYLGNNSQNLVPEGFPTMAFPGQGAVLTMAGEHTLGAWTQALSSQ